MNRTGFIYNIQRYCIHDGPGIRTDVFFKGCNFRCPWCANPESLRPVRELAFKAHKCTECGLCIRKCPQDALKPDRSARIYHASCNFCGNCVRYCPQDCYTIYGKEYSAQELLSEVMMDEPFYRNSGGGVTVTGGEPTMQFPFLTDFLRLCKENELDIAMETNGSASSDQMEVLSGLVDHFLIDVKHMDDEIHKKITGASNIRTLENILYLTQEKNCQVSIRVPCIPGFNMTDENMYALRDFAVRIQKSGNLQKINLLPYHNLGAGKYTSLDMTYTMSDIRPVKEAELEKYVKLMKEASLDVKLGG